jgi:hypothetical protein
LARVFGHRAGNRLRGLPRRSRDEPPLPPLAVERRQSRRDNPRRIRYWPGAAEWIVYDALYAYCREMVRQGKPNGDFVN